jgi:hypothetical protein
MRKSLSPYGVVPAALYLGLVAFSMGYVFYRTTYRPVNSEFCGLPLLVLTSPWSLWTTQVLALLRYNFDLSLFLNILLSMMPGAALNAWLLYVIGRQCGPKK